MKAHTLTLAVAMGALGCSTTPMPQSHQAASTAQNYRAEAVLGGAEARTIANGPALIKHLETVGDGWVTLYFASAIGEGCSHARGANEYPFAMLAPSTRVTNIHVPEGKRVCAVGATPRSMVVTWHVGWEQPAAAPALARYRILAQH